MCVLVVSGATKAYSTLTRRGRRQGKVAQAGENVLSRSRVDVRLCNIMNKSA